jgi:hypothetical protein
MKQRKIEKPINIQVLNTKTVSSKHLKKRTFLPSDSGSSIALAPWLTATARRQTAETREREREKREKDRESRAEAFRGIGV